MKNLITSIFLKLWNLIMIMLMMMMLNSNAMMCLENVGPHKMMKNLVTLVTFDWVAKELSRIS